MTAAQTCTRQKPQTGVIELIPTELERARRGHGLHSAGVEPALRARRVLRRSRAARTQPPASTPQRTHCIPFTSSLTAHTDQSGSNTPSPQLSVDFQLLRVQISHRQRRVARRGTHAASLRHCVQRRLWREARRRFGHAQRLAASRRLQPRAPHARRSSHTRQRSTQPNQRPVVCADALAQYTALQPLDARLRAETATQWWRRGPRAMGSNRRCSSAANG